MATVQVSIASDADDGQYDESGASWNSKTDEGYYAGEHFQVRADPGSSDSKWGAVRFTGIAVAQGTTITSATLRLYMMGASALEAGTRIRIFGDDVDNSAALGASHHPQSGWTNTTAYVDFDPNSVTPPDTVNIDVTTIAQEIINRVGWASGNAMSFALDGEAEGTDTYFSVNFADYDADTLSTELARITIVYPDGGGGMVILRRRLEE